MVVKKFVRPEIYNIMEKVVETMIITFSKSI